jgi:NAD(P)H-flavin reductase
MLLTDVIDHTPNVRELVLATIEPDRFSFKAGQFVTLHVPQEPKPALRAYSIASSDEVSTGFRLLFKYVPGGVASTYVWKLKKGDELQFTGPFGRIFFKTPPSQKIIFLNTGTGLAQHLSYLLSNLKNFPELQCWMLFGVRNESEIYYREQLEALTKALPNFKYEFVLSRPSEKWTGKKGYVQHFIKDFDYKGTDTTFYLCGNGGMIKEVKQQLIEGENFDKTKILAEAFD